MVQSAATSASFKGKLLEPSKLGTKEYWDDVYDRELQNQEDDEDDEGTIWFSESNAEEAVLAQLARLHDAGLLKRSYDKDAGLPPSRFLDVGTGNGHMLFELREPDDDGSSWEGELVGVDYSEASVQLARRIAEQKHIEKLQGTSQTRFEHWDLLKAQPGDWLADGFDVVLDKGTFDAISLMPHNDDLNHPCKVYREKVTLLIKRGGFLMVTSCNWTKQELVQWLASDDSGLTYFDEARYPTFTFGGQSGQAIVTIAFRRKGR